MRERGGSVRDVLRDDGRGDAGDDVTPGHFRSVRVRSALRLLLVGVRPAADGGHVRAAGANQVRGNQWIATLVSSWPHEW